MGRALCRPLIQASGYRFAAGSKLICVANPVASRNPRAGGLDPGANVNQEENSGIPLGSRGAASGSGLQRQDASDLGRDVTRIDDVGSICN